MAQHDYVIDNSTGANVRSDINDVLQAIATNNSGSSAPSTTVATQFFADTSAGIMKLRNTANSGYVNLFTLAGGIDVDAASNFNEDVTFTGATSGRNIVFDKSSNALRANDNASVKFGTDGDADIFHDGTDLFIREIDSGQILFRSDGQQVFTNQAGSENRILTQNNGKVALYYDHTERFATNSTGAQVTGTFTCSSHFNVGDNVQIQLGNAANNDFILVHDGTDNIINCGNNGNLFLRSASTHLQSLTGENKVVAEANGAVELYHDNVKSLETTATGCTIQKDGSNINASLFIKATNGGQAQLQIEAGGNQGGGVSRAARIDFVNTEVGTTPLWTLINDYLQNGTNDFSIRHGAEESITANPDSSVELFFDNSKKLETTSSGVSFSGDTFMPDGEYAHFGTGNDLYMGHTGTLGNISNVTGNFEIHANEYRLRSFTASNETMMQASLHGDANLWYDNVKRFETTDSGVIVNGKYQQETAGGTHVYARQIFRESIAANATKTFTVTNLAYGNVKLTMGFGDGNFHYAAFAAVLGGNMYSVGNAYAAAQLLNDRSGVNSITVTKSNSSYAVAIHAGTNQIFGSVVLESNNYDTNSGATLTIS